MFQEIKSTVLKKMSYQRDIRSFLSAVLKDGITDCEIDGIIRDLEKLPASDLYENQ